MLRISSIWTLFIQKYLITVNGLKIVCIDKRLDWKKYMYMYHLKISLNETSLQSLFLMMAQIPVLYSSQIYIAKCLLIALPQKLFFSLRQRRRGIVSTNQSLFCLPAKVCYHDRIWLLEVKKATQVHFRFNLSFSLFVISNCWDWKSFPKDHIHFFL